MPVPWGTASVQMPLVENRATTIAQLRDLWIFVKRLCKARLLRTSHSIPISIFEVNMYHLRELVIKPVIGAVEAQRGSNRHYSWVEFVSPVEKQSPAIMISHSWAGRFYDFNVTVDKLVDRCGLSGSVGIWICTFAINQFGEDFGLGLSDCPFARALRVSRYLVLIVDRDASSLNRIWCGFELHCSMALSKPLDLYASGGKIGKDVTSGPLVEAVEAWDVRCMEASQDSDRRQILNYLCGGPNFEKQGLRTDANGNYVLLDGWRKQLLGEELSASAPRRQDGRYEYAHEAYLFAAHKERLMELNLRVRQKVLAAVGHSSAARRVCKHVPLEDGRGITLGELRSAVRRLRDTASSMRTSLQLLSTWQVATQLLPRLVPAGFSYVEFLGCGARSPQYVVDQLMSRPFQELVSSIEWFAEANQLADSTILFVPAFCLFPEELAHADPKIWRSILEKLIIDSKGFFACMAPGGENILRSYKMLQLQICFNNAKPIYLGCLTGVLACMVPFPSGVWEFGNFDLSIARFLLDAHWDQAKSSVPRVEIEVLEFVRNCFGGLEGFGSRLARVAAGPILRDAALRGDEEAVQEILALGCSPSFLINSLVLRGASGETSLHIAAALGHEHIVKLLLMMRADPDAEDDLRETPLHYAALAGRTESVRLLCEHCKVSAESSFVETPLYVAKQNVASFLDIDTRSVVALLSRRLLLHPMHSDIL